MGYLNQDSSKKGSYSLKTIVLLLIIIQKWGIEVGISGA
jgi:hypothetical protein